MPLGSKRRQRLHPSQSLLVLTVYVVFALVQHGEVQLGIIESSLSWPLTAWRLIGGTMFFVTIRSGLKLRLPASLDPALPIPKSLWATTAIAWSYCITAQARGGVILIMILVVTFSILLLDARQARLLAAAGFAMIMSVMAYKAHVDPVRYEQSAERSRWFLGPTVAATISASENLQRALAMSALVLLIVVEVGLITPPVGINLLVINTITVSRDHADLPFGYAF